MYVYINIYNHTPCLGLSSNILPKQDKLTESLALKVDIFGLLNFKVENTPAKAGD